jgi:hypothetical protein
LIVTKRYDPLPKVNSLRNGVAKVQGVEVKDVA